VTHLKPTEQQALALATERAQVKGLADFVRDVSHDFRTPLVAISTSAYLLLRTADPEKLQLYLGSVDI
jgi:signal transduction histidine kinase